MAFKYFMKHNTSSLSKGFTIIEIIVVLGIFAVTSGIILFSYKSFRTNTTVTTVSQEIALTVRKAQAYSLGLQANGVLANLPIKGYGVRFESNQPDQITFFTELPSGSPAVVDNQFTTVTNFCGAPAPGEECVEYYKIETGDKIEELVINGDVLKLTDPLSSVDVIFKKPSGDVVFCVHSSVYPTCSSTASTPVNVFDIVLVSQDGVRKYVHVYGNGQISTD
jgi:prepilin-type N-terminal cleavage/methylation domain-containing protein